MPYWQLFYHLVWSTANREPLLTPDVEPTIYGFLRSKAIGLNGVVFALNGAPNHVHMVCSIPPSVAVAKFVGQIKAVASVRFNRLGVKEAPLYWQGEYGAFSFDSKRLPHFVAYVERQKEHHAAGAEIPVLERTAEGGVGLVREPPVEYATGYDDWWRSMLGLEGV
jgi:putative transposase